MNEMQQIEYNDVLTDLASTIEQNGCRKFLLDFQHNYPQHFQEILVQIHRLEKKPIARLLDKDAPPV